ncbi:MULTISPECIES: 3-keto-5-aminohexanoate cleavage protein [Paraburkholderia]|uniref:3-keto-5-aminohexanoate cleavage protein n=1 Tax=Paraburkholderia madseniana TaxID=2599607 RepID=A0AAP5BNZ3_9BURK|nr:MULTISPECIES: 3-keto-5-aminohexanoate cleavage protein [Paraburkholderia]MCX4152039.1 3-keto-5-aminohexanoate cleavage protein [Paraburkholderia madseniana]MCX4175636.1 3-keto-5-aminohexanoate cleavage protein [Paraburkholderia madseniana]MDN7154967.1 3-keto-5-aminohexanoate cleavage protein [Paraburkholderia sp. WS6]MDQ6413850.1 3-keto-5-aminohexanoate cleavage protein [Paraburkholderia madseniana]MDQ6463632.1 3-keto-5-aminohexanoate cleavage protein [Paraburkholderia madseniana]
MSSAAKKTILTVAVTGNITKLEQHPGLPCTPRQIAKEVVASARAGAAIAHIHVRHPDGRPSMEVEHYREVMDRVRDSGCDIIINLTTGPGQRYVPGLEDPAIAGPGTTLMLPERRVEHILELRPEVCTLDLNTMWSGDSAVINAPASVARMAELIRSVGTRAELELFDSGDIHLASSLIRSGAIPEDCMVQIVLGSRWGFDSSARTLLYALGMLPTNVAWAAFGIGRHSFPIVAQSFLLGGHVRVGMEDNIYVAKGELTRGNEELVEKAARIVRELGGQLASPDEAREIIGLGVVSTAN